ncbi:hypothetical protein [Bosea sp. 124]|uniref:hypothetical protein n=1 Tax=Bosea sp. 124 TaxID=2135642 RepID=UPI0011B26B1F|nr:hypothetical protein [Bosea sp. 124]
MDDDKRLLIALISDTGLRLAEALELAKTDMTLLATVPHIDLKPRPWRLLKTASSTRTVPLAGASLLGAQRLDPFVVLLVIAPSSQQLELPTKPERFKAEPRRSDTPRPDIPLGSESGGRAAVTNTIRPSSTKRADAQTMACSCGAFARARLARFISGALGSVG